MLKKTGKEWKFESEVALEDFVWANLDCLFKLDALKRQYIANGEVCDILARDENGRLVVLELKNTQDRYIVQQLIRYYDNLLNEKPLNQEINYELPVRLIAIAPIFHNHNWIDRKYHKLDLEFVSFTMHQEDNFIYFNLKNLNTENVSQAKILDLSIKNIKTAEFAVDSYEKTLNDTLSYYVLVRYAHKLGIPELDPLEVLRLSSQRHRAKGAKVFKIRIKDKILRDDRYVSVRVPAKIGVYEFVIWVGNNLTSAIEVVSPSGSHYPV
jgi:hypothetical protein